MGPLLMLAWLATSDSLCTMLRERLGRDFQLTEVIAYNCHFLIFADCCEASYAREALQHNGAIAKGRLSAVSAKGSTVNRSQFDATSLFVRFKL